ncbi:multidrug efflux SMR transporter [Actinomadura sp. ATCC 31491]|uniref:Multidrug efflux SMR transporter n=1 Tax=Actinomadura luzonensis TaxID=2805427 RepID=A0ABT0G5J1_9ACTN|nr:multidrug efflux SMR transporter [Actinomadura luzonensis]MCK2219435.1 multidrug efflux SMR transporter [Actinomadura luzonensis]
MAWVLIVAAGLFEVAMAYSLKLSDGFSALWPSVAFGVAAVLSFGLLALALKNLEVGTAYAVWTGIGAVGTAAVGMIVLGESASPLKLVSIGLILCGVVGLNLAGAGH